MAGPAQKKGKVVIKQGNGQRSRKSAQSKAARRRGKSAVGSRSSSNWGNITGATPIALHQHYSQRRPSYRGVRGERHFTISNTELVGDVNVARDSDAATAAGFQITSFPINAGNPDLFVWLAELAAEYELYKFVELKLHFVPTLPTTAAGQVFLIPDYDPTDPQPVTAQTAMVVPGAEIGSIYEPVTMNLDIKALNNCMSPMGHGYYVAHPDDGGIPGADLRLVDSGTVYVATRGMEATSLALSHLVVGSLYVSYRCELSLPQSSQRLVRFGSQTAHVTQPGPFIPKQSRLRAEASLLNNHVSTGSVLRTFNTTQGTKPEPVPNADPLIGEDMRNFMQYWSDTAQAFVFDKMKVSWRQFLRFTIYAATAPAAGYAVTKAYHYRPLLTAAGHPMVTKPEDMPPMPEGGFATPEQLIERGFGIQPGETIELTVARYDAVTVTPAYYADFTHPIEGIATFEAGDHFWTTFEFYQSTGTPNPVTLFSINVPGAGLIEMGFEQLGL